MQRQEERILLLKNGFYDRFRRAKTISYRQQVLGEVLKGENVSDLYNWCLDNCYRQDNPINQFLGAKRFYDSNKGKNKRLNKRIKDMMQSGECVFLTLTFRNDVLESTNEETRRTYVRKSLCSLNCDFVANVDFGKKNEREHYHALVKHNKLSEEELTNLWAYGFSSQRVAKYYGKDEDGLRLARYINKLSNHAKKESTKGIKLIYSRNKTKMDNA